MLSGRQHRDDHVGARSRDLRGLGDRAAGRFELAGRGLADIDAFDLVAGLEQVSAPSAGPCCRAR
jgi:hypothetical protein